MSHNVTQVTRHTSYKVSFHTRCDKKIAKFLWHCWVPVGQKSKESGGTSPLTLMGLNKGINIYGALLSLKGALVEQSQRSFARNQNVQRLLPFTKNPPCIAHRCTKKIEIETAALNSSIGGSALTLSTAKTLFAAGTNDVTTAAPVPKVILADPNCLFWW